MIAQDEVMSMFDLIGDSELDLLILPIIVTTLVLEQALETSGNWFRRHARLSLSRVAAECRRLKLAA